MNISKYLYSLLVVISVHSIGDINASDSLIDERDIGTLVTAVNEHLPEALHSLFLDERSVSGLLTELRETHKLDKTQEKSLQIKTVHFVNSITSATGLHKMKFITPGKITNNYEPFWQEITPLSGFMRAFSKLVATRFGVTNRSGKIVDGISTPGSALKFSLWYLETTDGPLCFAVHVGILERSKDSFEPFEIPYSRDSFVIFHNGMLETRNGFMFDPTNMNRPRDYRGELGLQLGAPYFKSAPISHRFYGDILDNPNVMNTDTGTTTFETAFCVNLYSALVRHVGGESEWRRVPGVSFIPLPTLSAECYMEELLFYEDLEEQAVVIRSKAVAIDVDVNLLRAIEGQQAELRGPISVEEYKASLEEAIISGNRTDYDAQVKREWETLKVRREVEEMAAQESKHKKSKNKKSDEPKKPTSKRNAKVVVDDEEQERAELEKLKTSIRKTFIAECKKRAKTRENQTTRVLLNAYLSTAAQFGLPMRLRGNDSHFYASTVGATQPIWRQHGGDKMPTDTDSTFRNMLSNLVGAIERSAAAQTN